MENVSHPTEFPLMKDRLADIGAASSLLAWLSSVAVQTLPIIQWCAGMVAIFAGLCAAYYHLKKARSV